MAGASHGIAQLVVKQHLWCSCLCQLAEAIEPVLDAVGAYTRYVHELTTSVQGIALCKWAEEGLDSRRLDRAQLLLLSCCC